MYKLHVVVHSVSQKNFTPMRFSENFSPTAGNFKHATTEQRTILGGYNPYIPPVGYAPGHRNDTV